MGIQKATITGVLETERMKERTRAIHARKEEYPFEVWYLLRRSYPFVDGLETFAGRRVLEIGAYKNSQGWSSLEKYFTDIGADYRAVTLQDVSADEQHVKRLDFMELDHRTKYDLVYSSGVLEYGGLNKTNMELANGLIYHTDEERVRKLAKLTKKGGFQLHATRTELCLYDNDMFIAQGFDVLYRRRVGVVERYKLWNKTDPTEREYLNFSGWDGSEIIVLQKR